MTDRLRRVELTSARACCANLLDFLLAHHLWLLLALAAAASTAEKQLPAVTASASRLDQLYRTEHKLIGQLKLFYQLADDRLSRIDSYLDAYEQEVLDVHAASNTARDFKLLQRIEQYWTADLLSIDRMVSAFGEVKSIVSSLGKIPGREAAVETISALLMTQNIYKLDAQQLASGQILGLPTGTVLLPADVKKLADISFGSRALHVGLVWLETLMRMTSPTGSSHEHQHSQLHQYARQQLTARVKQHDQLVRNASSVGDTGGFQLFAEPIGSRSAVELQQQSTHRLQLTDSAADEEDTYSALCRGHDTTSQQARSRLHCSLESPHPYYSLAPLRKEVVHWDPQIVAYRNFLSTATARKLVQLARPKMKRSAVGPYGKTIWSRVSSTARMPSCRDQDRIKSGTGGSDEDPACQIVDNIESKVHMVTSLLTTNSSSCLQEPLQVAEYGTGGFFQLHHDFLNISNHSHLHDKLPKDFGEEHVPLEAGERTATWMIYMGGRTVFPRLGVSLAAEEGTAVFWYNKLADDSLDTRTLHAGCPVVYGYKYIANKFIRDAAQTFTYPCRNLDSHDNER